MDGGLWQKSTQIPTKWTQFIGDLWNKPNKVTYV